MTDALSTDPAGPLYREDVHWADSAAALRQLAPLPSVPPGLRPLMLQAADEIERLRELLSIAQDRNAEHCAEVQRLEREKEGWASVAATRNVNLALIAEERDRMRDALKQIIALTTGPDRGSAAWQIEAAVEIAQSALTRTPNRG